MGRGADVSSEASSDKMRLGLLCEVLHGDSGMLAVNRLRPDNFDLGS